MKKSRRNGKVEGMGGRGLLMTDCRAATADGDCVSNEVTDCVFVCLSYR